MRVLWKRLWCWALGHGTPWITVEAMGARYHFCPRCGADVCYPPLWPQRRS